MKNKKFHDAQKLTDLAEAFVINLKVILAYAPNKAKAPDVVDALMRLGESLEKYFENQKQFDRLFKHFALFRQEPIKLSYVIANSANEWIIRFGWMVIREVNETVCNLWLYMPEHRDTDSREMLLANWSKIRSLFSDGKKASGFAQERIEKPSNSVKLVFNPKILPTLKQLEELRGNAKWELVKLLTEVEKLTISRQFKPGSEVRKLNVPLHAEIVLSIIRRAGKDGILAKEIVQALKCQGVTITESTLRRHQIPYLKLSFNVINVRNNGYMVASKR